MSKSKNIFKDKKVQIIIIIAVALIVIVLAWGISKTLETDTVSSEKVEIKKEITDNDIIEFAKNEIKKKLRHPETARFQKEEILGKEDNKIVVSIYSVSDDKNNEEGRLHFVLGIKNNKNILEMFNIATNEDTCNADVAEEFERLMKINDYEQIYNQLFTTNLKKQITLEEFKGYKINMYAAENVTANLLADNSILTSFYDSINKKSYIITIKNGMIIKIQQV